MKPVKVSSISQDLVGYHLNLLYNVTMGNERIIRKVSEMQLKVNTGPGRPTVIDENAILRLETAFALGCNRKEALMFSGVSKDAYFRLLQRQPEFRDRFDQLRQTPVLMAKRNVAMAIAAGDLAVSKWYLEKRDPEFMPKALQCFSGANSPLNEAEILQRLAKFFPVERRGLAE